MMNLEKFTDQVFNQDALEGMKLLPDESIDLIVADPPYNLGKDYGNDSDNSRDVCFLYSANNFPRLARRKSSFAPRCGNKFSRFCFAFSDLRRGVRFVLSFGKKEFCPKIRFCPFYINDRSGDERVRFSFGTNRSRPIFVSPASWLFDDDFSASCRID